MSKDKLIEAIKKELIGIDLCETDDENGWWETSKGAEFGEAKLEAILKLIEEYTK